MTRTYPRRVHQLAGSRLPSRPVMPARLTVFLAALALVVVAGRR